MVLVCKPFLVLTLNAALARSLCVCEYLLCLVQSWSLTLEVYWQAEQVSEWEFGFGISLHCSGFSSAAENVVVVDLSWAHWQIWNDFQELQKRQKQSGNSAKCVSKVCQCTLQARKAGRKRVDTYAARGETVHHVECRNCHAKSICKRYERAIDLNFHVLNAIIWHRNRQKKQCMHRINGQLSGENTQVANDTDGSSCC